MTESEWLACRDPETMLKYLRQREYESATTISDRRTRLLACACCRKVFHLFKDQRSVDAIETAEAFADGMIPRKQYAIAKKAASAAAEAGLVAYERHRSKMEDRPEAYSRFIATRAVSWAMLELEPDPDDGPLLHSAIAAVGFAVDGYENFAAGEADQAAIIRDLFGNPFRSVVADPAWIAWQNGVIPTMADETYTQRSYALLPILADALEDAGCTATALLAHCREPGDHVRGCWALDLVLGKG